MFTAALHLKPIQAIQCVRLKGSEALGFFGFRLRKTSIWVTLDLITTINQGFRVPFLGNKLPALRSFGGGRASTSDVASGKCCLREM